MNEEERQVYNYMKMQDLGIAPSYSDIPTEKPQEKFLEQLNPEKICEYLENLLRGKKWNSEEERWEDDPYAIKVNERGISVIMRKVRSIVNPNTIYSNLDREIIENIVMDFVSDLAFTLAMKYKEFGIEVIDIATITKMCSDVAYISLMRGQDAITMRLLRTAIQTREIVSSINKPEENRNLFDRLFRK